MLGPSPRWTECDIVTLDPCELSYAPHRTAQSSHFTLTPLPDLGAVQADKALALADLQVTEGFRFDAQLNYHTACVYYRVMECLVPSLTATVHKVSQLNVHLSRPIGP